VEQGRIKGMSGSLEQEIKAIAELNKTNPEQRRAQIAAIKQVFYHNSLDFSVIFFFV
jgi:hypothetical protein